MNGMRRFTLAVVVLAMLVIASGIQAQALKQLPADALVVIKVNNLQSVSDKAGALAKKLGLADLLPPLADPLAALRAQLSVKEGLDAKGEMALGIYAPGEGESEPRILVLLPVTDFQALLGQHDQRQAGRRTQLLHGAQRQHAALRGQMGHVCGRYADQGPARQGARRHEYRGRHQKAARFQ